MKTYWYDGVEYTITEEEFENLLNDWTSPRDLFG